MVTVVAWAWRPVEGLSYSCKMIQQQVVEVDDNDLNSFNSNVGEEMRRTCPCGMAGGASTVIKNQSKTSASHRKQLTYHSTLI